MEGKRLLRQKRRESYTVYDLVEVADPNAKEGEQTEKRTYPKTVYLFYIKQVEKKE